MIDPMSRTRDPQSLLVWSAAMIMLGSVKTAN
jgi:hypothetical protein